MTRIDLDALVITRPVRVKDCVICADTPPPSDDVVVAAGTVCLCARHEASLRERLAMPPETRAEFVHRVFGPIV